MIPSLFIIIRKKCEKKTKVLKMLNYNIDILKFKIYSYIRMKEMPRYIYAKNIRHKILSGGMSSQIISRSQKLLEIQNRFICVFSTIFEIVETMEKLSI